MLITKAGYFFSIIFSLQSVYSIIKAIAFPERFTQPIPSTSIDNPITSFFLAFDTDLVIFLLAIGIALMMIYTQPREVWKAWVALFAGPGVVSFFDWLSLVEGVLGIIIYLAGLCCSLYAFLAFRRFLKGGYIPR